MNVNYVSICKRQFFFFFMLLSLTNRNWLAELQTENRENKGTSSGYNVATLQEKVRGYPQPTRSLAPAPPGIAIKSEEVLACQLSPYLGLSHPKFGAI